MKGMWGWPLRLAGPCQGGQMVCIAPWQAIFPEFRLVHALQPRQARSNDRQEPNLPWSLLRFKRSFVGPGFCSNRLVVVWMRGPRAGLVSFAGFSLRSAGTNALWLFGRSYFRNREFLVDSGCCSFGLRLHGGSALVLSRSVVLIGSPVASPGKNRRTVRNFTAAGQDNPCLGLLGNAGVVAQLVSHRL